MTEQRTFEERIAAIEAAANAKIKALEDRLAADRAAADAVELARKRAGSPVLRPESEQNSYERSSLADPVFFQRHRADILSALREPGHPRIIDDKPAWRVPGSKGTK
jgi:hypothetical protein